MTSSDTTQVMDVVRPSEDMFYEPADAAWRVGRPLRLREVVIATTPAASVWQIVYGSTGASLQPIAVSGTVLVPAVPWRGPGPRPVLTYGVGVHGLGRDFAPSYLMRLGAEVEVPLISLALARGWAVAVTDGEGLGMPGPHTYGAGRPGGHAMLDIVRAAAVCVPGIDADAPVLVWGYSEGGRCAAWAAELQPGYAPDVRVVAVAAGGVPSDLYVVGRAIDGGPYAGLAFAVVVGLAHAHDRSDLWRVFTPEGREAVDRATTLDVLGLIVDFPDPIHQHTVDDDPWEGPAWRSLLREERNGQLVPCAPMYVYHAVDDEIVPVSLGVELVDDYRRHGASVDWVPIAGTDHLSAAFLGATGALTWLADHLEDRHVDR